MKTFALPFIFFISANYALGASFDCKSWSWQRDYKEEVKKDVDYATSIDKFFEKSFQTHGLSAEKISHQCNSINSNRYSPPSIQSISTSKKCVSTKGIVGLEALPCFHYQVIPARKKSKGTVIRFQGGPGDILQFSRFQLDDYSIIAFNDIGVGDNSFPIDTRIKWQVFGDANQALILERILKEENVDNYVLYGGSYGSVTATMLGKKLSSGKRPPKAVLLVGVIADAPKSQANQNNSQTSSMKSEKGPSSSKTCLLERKGECSDDSFLTFLNDKEKKTLQKKTSEFFRDKNRVPFLALIKDALHWEYVHSPEQAAQFLKDYVLKENATVRMKCWYDREFKNIPWLNRFKSSSQMAFYNIHNCFFSTPSENRMNNMCSCLDRLPSYKVLNYQIQAPTKIFYVNGEFDSQTPLKGAQSHFEQQKSETKAFLKICGAGHLPIRDTASATDHSISANEVFSKILSGDVKGFLRINSYCK